MKKVKLFFSILLVLSILTSANIFAQSESSDVIGISPGDTQVTEPMIAVNPIDPNNFITVYSKWVDELRRPASSSTTDGGITWSSTEVPENLYRYPVPLSERPDPTVAFDADGYAHFCYMDEQRQTPYLGFRRDLVVAHSTNKGATWHDTSVVYDYLRYTTQYRVDKPWITADCNSYSTYKNSQYIAFTSIYNWESGNEQYAIQFSYKRPGEYYCKPFKISPVVGGSQKVFGAFPVVGLDGTIYVFWGLQTYSQESQTTSSSIQMVELTNGGQNFSSPVTIKTGIAESEFQISFQKAHSWPYVVVNPLDGSLNMVYGNGTKLYFSFSTNKGVTWSTSSNKGMSTSTSAWNPNITCNSKGKLAVVYYTSGYKVIVATGYATDESFEIFDQGSSNFSNPYKFTDYIGIACNDYTYLGVWPAPYQPTSKSKIFGRHRTIGALVENLSQDHLQFDNSKLYFDGGTAKTSPYSTATNLFPGKTHTLKIYSPTIIKNGSTYNFYQWEDENGLLLSTNAEISVPIDNHKYRAMFNYQAPPPPQSVTVYIKNEFKDPDNTIRNGGTVNVDEEDVLNTEDLPGQQVTKTYLQGDHLILPPNSR